MEKCSTLCQTSIEAELEAEALALAADRGRLRRRLRAAANLTIRDLRKEFIGAKFDFENKRLVTRDGCRYLQWRVREFPDMPPSFHNQQTSVGYVCYVADLNRLNEERVVDGKR